MVHATSDTTYDELLSIKSDVSFHQRHLLTEVFKSVYKLNPNFMWGHVKMNFSHKI